jgi:hypothetical protein
MKMQRLNLSIRIREEEVVINNLNAGNIMPCD